MADPSVERASRPFCAEVSAEYAEPLAATASRVDHWVLLEYRGVWSPDALAESALQQAVKDHLGRQLEAVPRSRLLFIRRPDRRRRSGLLCFFGSSRERSPSFFRAELDDHEQLLTVDLAAALRDGNGVGEPLEHPLLVVCMHGKRDRCCARYGRPLFDALSAQAEDEWLWQSTHVGGDRFAGNVVCFPHGVYYGRVAPGDAWPLLDEHLAGRIYLDRFRGRCCYPFPVQAAEHSVRVDTGLTGLEDLELAGLERVRTGRWRIRFRARATGAVHVREVAEEQGELTYLTCSAETLRHPRRFVATGLRAVPRRE